MWFSRARSDPSGLAVPAVSASVVDLTTDDPSENRIHRMLDELGVSWAVPLRELPTRFGVTRHPVYDWDVIAPPLPKLTLPGMLFPLSTNAFRLAAPSPADFFSTVVSVADDPRINVEAAVEFFSAWLGEAAIEASGGFAFCAEWTAGPASVSLQASGPHPYCTPEPSEADRREPRLRRACSVVIEPGFRPALSVLEREQLESSRLLLRLDDDAAPRSLDDLRRRRPSVTNAPFAREPDDSCRRLLGGLHVSADGRTLVVCRDQLLVIPRERVTAVRVSKLTRARGPAGSWLDLICVDEASDDGLSAVTVLEKSRTDQLDGRARSLGATLGVPVDIRPAQQNA